MIDVKQKKMIDKTATKNVSAKEEYIFLDTAAFELNSYLDLLFTK